MSHLCLSFSAISYVATNNKSQYLKFFPPHFKFPWFLHDQNVKQTNKQTQKQILEL